jgi:hypothetical protein
MTDTDFIQDKGDNDATMSNKRKFSQLDEEGPIDSSQSGVNRINDRLVVKVDLEQIQEMLMKRTIPKTYTSLKPIKLDPSSIHHKDLQLIKVIGRLDTGSFIVRLHQNLWAFDQYKGKKKRIL